jgi:hypothetical protein
VIFINPLNKDYYDEKKLSTSFECGKTVEIIIQNFSIVENRENFSTSNHLLTNFLILQTLI